MSPFSIVASSSRTLSASSADMVSFGALFIANPDLPARLQQGGPFNTPNPQQFYGGDATGYTDYPTLGQE